MISCDLVEARPLSNCIAVLYLGAIVERSEAEALYENPVHPYTKVLLSAVSQAVPDSNWLSHRIHLAGEVPDPIDPPAGVNTTGETCGKRASYKRG